MVNDAANPVDNAVNDAANPADNAVVGDGAAPAGGNVAVDEEDGAGPVRKKRKGPAQRRSRCGNCSGCTARKEKQPKCGQCRFCLKPGLKKACERHQCNRLAWRANTGAKAGAKANAKSGGAGAMEFDAQMVAMTKEHGILNMRNLHLGFNIKRKPSLGEELMATLLDKHGQKGSLQQFRMCKSGKVRKNKLFSLDAAGNLIARRDASIAAIVVPTEKKVVEIMEHYGVLADEEPDGDPDEDSEMRDAAADDALHDIAFAKGTSLILEQGGAIQAMLAMRIAELSNDEDKAHHGELGGIGGKKIAVNVTDSSLCLYAKVKPETADLYGFKESVLPIFPYFEGGAGTNSPLYDVSYPDAGNRKTLSEHAAMANAVLDDIGDDAQFHVVPRYEMHTKPRLFGVFVCSDLQAPVTASECLRRGEKAQANLLAKMQALANPVAAAAAAATGLQNLADAAVLGSSSGSSSSSSSH